MKISDISHDVDSDNNNNNANDYNCNSDGDGQNVWVDKNENYLKGINFREFREFLKKSSNLILEKIMKMCKRAKFAKSNSREN